MKIIYSKGINFLNIPNINSILYPETDRTVKEIIDYINETVNDDTSLVTISETVMKQLLKMVKEKVLSEDKLEIETNLPEYKEHGLTPFNFLEAFVNYTKYLHNK